MATTASHFPPAQVTGNGAGGAIDPAVLNRTINNSDTGVFTWAGFALDGGANFTVGAGTGQIVDNETNPAIPTAKQISWLAQPLVALDIATQSVAYVLINSLGVAEQQANFPSPTQRRTNIFLGLWRSIDTVNIESLTTQLDVAFSKSQGLLDVVHEIGIIKDGGIVSANGTNLSLDITAGTLTLPGVNFVVNNTDPNRASIAAATPKTFSKTTQTVFIAPPVTQLDPLNSDVGGAVVSIGGSNNQATNQRVFLFPSGLMAVAYGQKIYGTLNEATQNADKEAFTLPPSFSDQGILIAVISIRKGALDLTLVGDAQILLTSPGGSVGFGASGIPIGTFQNILDNSVQPQATTKPATGSVQFQQGTGADTDPVVEILNGVGAIKSSFNGRGDVSAAGLFLARREVTLNLESNLGVNETILGVRNSTGTLITLRLVADAVIIPNKIIIVNDENGDATSFNISVATLGGALIDGVSFLLITVNFGTLRLYSDGTNWHTW